MKKFLLPWWLFFLGGCVSNTLPDYVKLGDLRILTIKASTGPEVNPGGSVTFQPVVSDVNGNGRALTYTVSACPDPGVGIGATPQCVGTPDFQIASTPLTLTNAFATSTHTGLAPTFSVTMPVLILTPFPPVQQFNGVPYLIFYTVTAADGTSVTSFRRVVISAATKTAKNNNPQITAVTLSGQALITTAPNSYPAASVPLSVTYPSTAAETYQVMNADGSFSSMTEELTTTWFYSDGATDYYRTTSNTSNNWSPPSPNPVGRNTVFVVVTRDGRGGEDFMQVEFQ